MKNKEFICGSLPITKEEVRACSLAKLDIMNCKNFLDIGSGTGSISVEAALINPYLQVLSVDFKDEAGDLIRANMEKFNIKNIEFIKTMAPFDLDEKFDAIFIGGSGDNLEEIITWSKNLLKDGGKMVANFIINESFNKAYELIKKNGFDEIEVIQMSVNVLSKLGKGEYFKPQNPIFIISCTNSLQKGVNYE